MLSDCFSLAFSSVELKSMYLDRERNFRMVTLSCPEPGPLFNRFICLYAWAPLIVHLRWSVGVLRVGYTANPPAQASRMSGIYKDKLLKNVRMYLEIRFFFGACPFKLLGILVKIYVQFDKWAPRCSGEKWAIGEEEEGLNLQKSSWMWEKLEL